MEKVMSCHFVLDILDATTRAKLFTRASGILQYLTRARAWDCARGHQRPSATVRLGCAAGEAASASALGQGATVLPDSGARVRGTSN